MQRTERSGVSAPARRSPAEAGFLGHSSLESTQIYTHLMEHEDEHVR